MSEMKCSKCGYTGIINRFCPSCGEKYVEEVVENVQENNVEVVKSCPRCNSSLLPNAAFCHTCGYNFNNPAANNTPRPAYYQPQYYQPQYYPPQRTVVVKEKRGSSCAAYILLFLIIGAILAIGVPAYQRYKTKEQSNDYETSYTKAEIKANASAYDYEELKRYPNSHKGEYFVVNIRLAQKLSDNEWRGYVLDEDGYGFTEEFYIFDKRLGSATPLIEDDKITAYVHYIGLSKAKRALTNTTVEIPSFNLYYSDILEK